MKRLRSPYRKRLPRILQNRGRIFCYRRLIVLWGVRKKRKRRCALSASCRNNPKPPKRIARDRFWKIRKLRRRPSLTRFTDQVPRNPSSFGCRNSLVEAFFPACKRIQRLFHRLESWAHPTESFLENKI